MNTQANKTQCQRNVCGSILTENFIGIALKPHISCVSSSRTPNAEFTRPICRMCGMKAVWTVLFCVGPKHFAIVMFGGVVVASDAIELKLHACVCVLLAFSLSRFFFSSLLFLIFIIVFVYIVFECFRPIVSFVRLSSADNIHRRHPNKRAHQNIIRS